MEHASDVVGVALQRADSLVFEESWTAAFHVGDRATMEAMYRDFFGSVRAAVGSILTEPDRETVVQDVFLRLLSSEALRHSYRGGSFSSWLSAVAKNQAIDYVRRRNRERPAGLQSSNQALDEGFEQRIQASMVVHQFRTEVLPSEWESVFEARFLRQLDQREAARAAGIPRTTLVYREFRIRRLLRRFLLGSERP